MSDGFSTTQRVWVFIGMLVVVALVATSYAVLTKGTNPAGAARSLPASTARLRTTPQRPFIMVRSLIPDDSHNKIGLVPLATPGGARYVSSLTCERVYFAGSRGVCLNAQIEGLSTKYYADLFDETFQTLFRISLAGVPSRARVSPDGRRVAITVFAEGHWYAERGFSTQTTLLDALTGNSLGDLEQFAVTRDGALFRAVDFNFWGVTFAHDGNRFYATLATGGTTYLVEGDIDERTARVVRAGVECPSLSPDNSRIVYKGARTIAKGGGWQLRLLDLTTMTDTPLVAETRSVDDQVDWLDDRHVVYHLSASSGADVWELRTDAIEPPRVLVPFAYSPAIVR